MDRWFTVHKSMSKAVELGSVEHLAWWATKCMPELEPMEVIIAKITAAKCHLGILVSHKGRRIDSNNANVVHWVHAHSELEVIMDVCIDSAARSGDLEFIKWSLEILQRLLKIRTWLSLQTTG